MNELLQLLNPIRDYSVEDAMKMATLQMRVPISEITPDDINGNERWIAERNVRGINLMGSIESIKKMVLTKEMFVCEVEKPVIQDVLVDDYDTDTDEGMEKWFTDLGLNEKGISEYNAWQAARAKVLFAGFEISKYDIHIIVFKEGRTDGRATLKFFYGHNGVSVSLNGEYFLPNNPTISDLIHAIEVYNRTPTNKISLEWTENILKLLIK